MKKAIEKAGILVEALPYIRKFRDKVMVVKCGGKVLDSEETRKNLITDIVLLWYVGVKPVLVHGGGIQVNELMGKLGKKSEFRKGLRKTDEETLSIVEMVLGKINKDLVNLINQIGGKAVGLSGKDGQMIKVKKVSEEIGFVGEIEKIDPSLLKILDEKGFIPVVAPLGVDREGKTHNINADSVAGEIAVHLKASKLILLTDIPGILEDPGNNASLLPSLTLKEVENLKRAGIIMGGMLPKVESARIALQGKVEKVHIINGNIPHAILLEIFTDQGIGTEILP
ncbi:acetylglutamate kinase [Candidatus Calescamantes bacterium]|nr:acetylglutamate kinase [Candidatus Calescamantes bacterium]